MKRQIKMFFKELLNLHQGGKPTARGPNVARKIFQCGPRMIGKKQINRFDQNIVFSLY